MNEVEFIELNKCSDKGDFTIILIDFFNILQLILEITFKNCILPSSILRVEMYLFEISISKTKLRSYFD